MGLHISDRLSAVSQQMGLCSGKITIATVMELHQLVHYSLWEPTHCLSLDNIIITLHLYCSPGDET